MVDQPGYIYFECKACGFDSVQTADFKGSSTCPLCDGDNNYSRMSQRVCREADKPEGRDARVDVRLGVAPNPTPAPKLGPTRQV